MGESIIKEDISVSLVMFNNDIQELKKAIQCTLNSYIVKKIYLIDNSPTDKLSVLENLDKDRIKYLFQNKNLGFGRAHNIGIRKAIKEGFKYHLILNPDIEFKTGVLEELTKYLKENKDCGLITPKVFYKNGDLQYLCKRIPSPIQLFGKRIPIKFIRDIINKKVELHNFDYNQILNVPYLSGCFMLCNVSIFNKAGLFDERYFMYMEDLDLSRSFHKVSKTIFYPKVSVIHGYRSESKVNKKLLKALIISAIKYFNKYGWFYDRDRVRFNKSLNNNITNLKKNN